MLKSLEIGGGISFGGDAGIDIGGFDIDTPEPTAQTMTTLDPHDATQFDGIGTGIFSDNLIKVFF